MLNAIKRLLWIFSIPFKDIMLPSPDQQVGILKKERRHFHLAPIFLSFRGTRGRRQEVLHHPQFFSLYVGVSLACKG